MKFLIRSNTKSKDPYASSTPPGKLPALKVFMMNVSGQTAVVITRTRNRSHFGSSTDKHVYVGGQQQSECH